MDVIMMNMNQTVLLENRIKTVRWLFYMSLFQLVACFAFPAIMFPAKVLLPIELLNALTVGMLFGFYFLGVNIYGLVLDRKRRALYTAMIVFVALWAIWVAVTWRYIEHMRYLT